MPDLVGEKLMEFKEFFVAAHQARCRAHMKLLALSERAVDLLAERVADGDVEAAQAVLLALDMDCDHAAETSSESE